MKTLLNKIEKLADSKFLPRNSARYNLVKEACGSKNQIVRTCWTSGSRRFTSNQDHHAETVALLNIIGAKFEQGNDSPRGGKTGQWIKVTGIQRNKTNA